MAIHVLHVEQSLVFVASEDACKLVPMSPSSMVQPFWGAQKPHFGLWVVHWFQPSPPAAQSPDTKVQWPSISAAASGICFFLRKPKWALPSRKIDMKHENGDRRNSQLERASNAIPN